MKLRKYICLDCHNQFWVDDEMEDDDVTACPMCWVIDGGIENQKIIIDIPDVAKGVKA